MTIRALIADDSSAVREGLRSILDFEDDVEVVGEATNGEEAVQKATELEPDVILMDFSMPILNGVEATRRVKQLHPDTAVVFLTMETESMQEAMDAGADSYLLKGSSVDEILDSVHSSYRDSILSSAHRTFGSGWAELLYKIVEEGTIALSQLKQAARRYQPGQKPCACLSTECGIAEEKLVEGLAGVLGVSFVRLGVFEAGGEQIDPVDAPVAVRLPEELARRYGMLAIGEAAGQLILAMSDPTDNEAIAKAAVATAMQIHPVCTTSSDIEQAFSRVYIPTPVIPAVEPVPAQPAWRRLVSALRGEEAPVPTAEPVRRPRTVQASLIQTVIRHLTPQTIILAGFLMTIMGAMYTVLQGLQGLHYIPAAIALLCGFFFFFYGLKYYISTAMVLGFSTAGGGILQLNSMGSGNGNGKNGHNGNGNKAHDGYKTLDGAAIDRHGAIDTSGNGFHLPKEKQPFVSIHLATYNERNVIDRLLSACTSMDYDNYEVVLVDDSTDDTMVKLEAWKNHPRLKIIHRTSRKGFKGSALQVAATRMDPRTKYIMIYDADFIPPADSIYRFLDYFGELESTNANANGNNGNGSGNGIDPRIAVVQGYQWHMLNAGQNWITRGVRTEFSGSYVLERPAQELYGGMKMISGSVYMIKADVVRELGWGTSITEDWEMTIRLYLAGYKVLYTPYIQAPAECVSAFRRLTRQRMRWAEGHTYNVKKYFWRILKSRNMTLGEKLEFVYYIPYYLQSVLFALGTTAWVASEIIFAKRLPNWPALLGWCLVFSNAFSLPVMNLAGIFMERSIKRDIGGILSFIALSNLLVPYQAYAALKALFEKEEGGWARTQKTGSVTETVGRFRLSKVLKRMMPGRGARGAPTLQSSRKASRPFYKRAVIWRTTISVIIAILLALAVLSTNVPVLRASPDIFFVHNSSPGGWPGYELSTAGPSGGTSFAFDSANTDYYWYSLSMPTGSDQGSIAAGTYSMNMYFQSVPIGNRNLVYYVEVGYSNPDGAGYTMLVRSGNQTVTRTTASNTAINFTIGATAGPVYFDAASPKRLRLQIHYVSGSGSAPFYVDNATYPTNLSTPSVMVPEGLSPAIIAGLIFLLGSIWLRRPRYIASAGVVAVLVFVVGFSSVVPVLHANPDMLYLHQNTPGGWPGYEMNTTLPSGAGTNFTLASANADYYWYSLSMPTGSDQGSIAAGAYSMNMYFQSVPNGNKNVVYYAEVGYDNPDGTGYTMLVRSANQTVDRNSPTNTAIAFNLGTTTNPIYFDAANPQRLRLQIHYVSGSGSSSFYLDGSTYPSNLSTPSVTVPEGLFAGIIAGLVFLLGTLWLRRPRYIASAAVMAMLVFVVGFSSMVPVLQANPDVLYLHQNTPAGWPGYEMNTTLPTGSGLNFALGSAHPDYYWYSLSMPTGSSQGSIAAGTYNMTMYYQNVPNGTKDVVYYLEVGYSNPDGSGYTMLVRSADQTINKNSSTNTAVNFTIGTTTGATTFDPASPKRLRAQIHYVSGAGSANFYVDNSTYPTNLSTPAIVVPEGLGAFIVLAVLGTIGWFWRRRRDGVQFKRAARGRRQAVSRVDSSGK